MKLARIALAIACAMLFSAAVTLVVLPEEGRMKLFHLTWQLFA
jgi:hypothetical protein